MDFGFQYQLLRPQRGHLQVNSSQQTSLNEVLLVQAGAGVTELCPVAIRIKIMPRARS